MGASAGNSMEAEAPTESVRVRNWRLQQFLLVGANPDVALVLANSTVDVRDYERIVAAGCDTETAAKILL